MIPTAPISSATFRKPEAVAVPARVCTSGAGLRVTPHPVAGIQGMRLNIIKISSNKYHVEQITFNL